MRVVGRLTHRSTSRRLRLALLITGVLLVLAPVTALAAVTFTDVPSSHPHYAGIKWAGDSGVSVGTANGDGTFSFKPDDNVTRGQMATFLHRTASIQVAAGARVNRRVIPFPATSSLGFWYNNVNGVAPVFTRDDVGEYTIDFKFDVTGRSILVTTQPTGLIILPGKPVVRWATANALGSSAPTKVKVWTYAWSTTEPALSDCTFDVVVLGAD